MAFDLGLNMPQGIKANLSEAKTRIEAIENAKAQTNGYASLDANGKVPVSQIPDVSKITKTTVAGLAALYALTVPAVVQSGDLVTVTDQGDTFQLVDESNVANSSGWLKIQLSNSDDVAEGFTNLYFTDARAKAVAVVNSTAGSETDQASSVASMKSYVSAQIGVIVKKYVKKLATGNIAKEEAFVYADITSANITLTLPALVSGDNGESHTIQNLISSTKNIVVQPGSGVTIGGQSSITLLPGDRVELVYNHATTDFVVLQ